MGSGSEMYILNSTRLKSIVDKSQFHEAYVSDAPEWYTSKNDRPWDATHWFANIPEHDDHISIFPITKFILVAYALLSVAVGHSNIPSRAHCP